ncbi:MAG: hypothetical protein ACMG57_02725, partial [Candidatus Dojkabacteria bacterium]
MKNLRDAPAVVIAFVYMLVSLPNMIFSIPGLFSSINFSGFRISFDLGSPISSLLSFVSLISKFGLILPVMFFIVSLIFCIIFSARKVNSLIVYYIISIFVIIFADMDIFLFTSGRGYINYADTLGGSLYTNYPVINSSEILTLLTSITSIIFMITVIYFLSRYKNLG